MRQKFKVRVFVPRNDAKSTRFKQSRDTILQEVCGVFVCTMLRKI